PDLISLAIVHRGRRCVGEGSLSQIEILVLKMGAGVYRVFYLDSLMNGPDARHDVRVLVDRQALRVAEDFGLICEQRFPAHGVCRGVNPASPQRMRFNLPVAGWKARREAE